jgi:high-affinity Fe2+/Pb2+ permease
VLSWLRIGTHPLWDTSRILSENSPLGDLLHAFFGYAEAPTALQSLLYLTYLAIAGGLFWRLTSKPRPMSAPASSTMSATSSPSATTPPAPAPTQP